MGGPMRRFLEGVLRAAGALDEDEGEGEDEDEDKDGEDEGEGEGEGEGAADAVDEAALAELVAGLGFTMEQVGAARGQI